MSTKLNTHFDALKLDKSSWKKVRFGDVAIQQKENVDRENTYLTRYIKGEHMGSEDLHIREWGELTDEYLGPAFIRKFSRGDILYGSRRTYLRKVAIADFNGITSNTTFVIKANTKKIDERLLPFIMLSEGFAEHSIKNSKGSVNPYINWKDIANYQFLLPPKDQQAKLAELLWALDEVMERERGLVGALEKYLISMEISYFSENPNVGLGRIIENSFNGGTPDTSVDDYYKNGNINWITTKTLNEDFICCGEKLITEEAIRNSATNVLPKENILAGTRVGVGKFSINLVDMSFSQDINGLIVDKSKTDLEFLIYQLNSLVIQRKIKPLLRGTTIKGILKEDLLEIGIFLPDLDSQKSIANSIRKIKNSLKKAKLKVIDTKKMQKSLINQIF